ncbi:MAG: DUF6340 family protein [Bacteroidales bacterium]|jgi:tetratricopeptide (TPR) repeat protein|nr:DUF6340 family protein [Bacteroidales bacterium]
MKNYSIKNIMIVFLLVFVSCQPLSTFQIETLKPAPVNFPSNFSKILFVNLDNDINNDNVIDTLVYKIITKEMHLGLMDGAFNSPNIDSSSFVFTDIFYNKDQFYTDSAINWNYLNDLMNKYESDLIIVLDSVVMLMNDMSEANYDVYPVEFYKFRDFSVTAYWKFVDLYEKSVLDTFVYTDTLYWDLMKTNKKELENEFPTTVQCLKELSYYTALDYSKRIFPVWKTETRFYYIDGNKQFRLAASLVNEGKWNEASEIWKQYVKNTDKELASRACFNLAVASEMEGNIEKAVQWAQISFDIKEKKRTRYYILKLKNRLSDIDKLKNQV